MNDHISIQFSVSEELHNANPGVPVGAKHFIKIIDRLGPDYLDYDIAGAEAVIQYHDVEAHQWDYTVWVYRRGMTPEPKPMPTVKSEPFIDNSIQ